MAKYMRGDTVRATAMPALVADEWSDDESADVDDVASLPEAEADDGEDVGFDSESVDRPSLVEEAFEVRLESSVVEASDRSRSSVEDAESEDWEESEASEEVSESEDELRSSVTALAWGTIVVEALSSVTDPFTSVSR